MKKILALSLCVVMLLGIAAVSMGATTTVGGNVRVWYINTDNGTSKDNTFVFDRVALDLKTDLGEGESLFTEIQGRTVNKGIDKETHFFVDQAVWSKANLLVDGGTLMVGAFDGQVPFKNGYGNVMIVSGLGDGLKIGNSVGAVYQYNNDLFGFGLGVVNANTGFTKNAAETSTIDGAGYAFSTRIDYKPMAGLKIGAGYAALQDVEVESVNAEDVITVTNSIYAQNRMVVDASYKNMEVTPFSGMVEYAKVDFDGATEDRDAYYGEVGYTLGNAVAYFGYGDGDIFGNVVKSQQCTSTFKIIDDDFTVVGLVYALSGTTFLQGEYTKSGKDNDGIGLRLRVNF